MAVRAAAVALAAVAGSGVAYAQSEGQGRFQVSASFGAALPIGRIEEGSDLRDVTFAAAPFELAASYGVRGPWRLAAAGSYAVSIPTLCANGSDCMASLGRDVTLSLLGVYAAPALGCVHPAVSLGAGYEWFTSKLSARGATSSRNLHGFVAPVMDIEAGFRAGRRWMLGPFLRASAGRFTGGALHGPSDEEAALATESRWHGWLQLGFRLSLRP